jgi:S-formylglutathione hydrolase FrmB
MNPLYWSLVNGPLPVILLVAGLLVAGLLTLALLRAGRRWLTALVPLIVVAMVIVAAVLIDRVWRPFPEALPVSVLVWTWAGLTGIALALAGQPLLRSWRGRIGAVMAGVIVLAAAGNQINVYYQEYPSLWVALGPWLDKKPVFTGDNQAAPEVTAGPGQALTSVWHPPAGLPKAGRVYQVTIAGKVSKFPARSGFIYLPPAYLSSPRAQLPVLVLLAGQPGDPSQWVYSGGIQQMMDAFAAQHEGLAPVVVMPDDLGGELANPLCIDSRLGNAQTYLTTDVPDWVMSHLSVRPPARGWAIGGFSHGGTCSIQLTTQAPRLFPVFVDISGQDEPTLGSRQLTIDKAFGGDAAAFARVNPIDVLSRTRFPGNAGVFVGGADDHEYTPQQRVMYQASRQAGMDVTFEELPGGHSWQVWKAGLQRNLAWLAARTGITQ